MSVGRVLLVNPRVCSRKNARLPLSLLSLGAVLESKAEYEIIDGNLLQDRTIETIRAALESAPCSMVAVSVMPGPQVAPAIELSAAVRKTHPQIPIVWGGYFPTLYPDAAINAPYVDYVIRSQGEVALIRLLERLPDAGSPKFQNDGAYMSSASDASALSDVPGLTWKRDSRIVHNVATEYLPPDDLAPLPYERLDSVDDYLKPSFMGTRTAVHQAAVGCRFRCQFCGVVSMFDGYSALPSTDRLRSALGILKNRYGATAFQFVDHNFFDREASSIPVLETLSDFETPWWCYARADALAGFSSQTWKLLKRSQLKMAYIGAEAASDEALRRMKKGAKVDQTLEVAARCREHGIIPEFSFILGGPDDPESETEQTLSFIRRLKKIHPECEVILYFYTPTPQRDAASRRADLDGTQIPIMDSYGANGPAMPTTPEEWTQKRWVDFACHQDAPWLTDRIRQRVNDFSKVLYCRFPTVQDYHTPQWGKRILRTLASWRYATKQYGKAWELDLARRLIPLRQPQNESL